ncbi:alpha/beta fold hydrolase [Actinoalloteichus hymeniacidonis]|uniref:Hydrolase or acyltransferase of alpha/beta superfamily n=1 Tax=Actinoalloteichus hymeniacidonis TaxID=340345 RepID=A0AAC9MXX2_9PSEU|nr:alpha/beta hydrolase [Actinoalloteichus hymeniacidonis]AOS62819.1 putative hydrolase or acyltransferase of alpha/beta superfamily [Actinoalloteichus hymeniacidonis]MBB5909150.1 proline iminopeptidase [Actinoalloteichus hymeniacidonis]
MTDTITELVRLSDRATLWTESTRLPDAPGVVFVHGGPGMWDYLGPLAATVADEVSTHRFDQRSCGRSSPSDDQRLDRLIGDLEELREHFGHRRWFVVGHSFGATLGLAYAAAHPARVSGLVYCSGVGLDWPQHRAAYRARASARLTPQQRTRRDELARRERNPAEEIEWRTLCWLPDFADPARAAIMAGQDAAAEFALNHHANSVLNSECARWAVAGERAACSRVRAPVLVIRGTADPRPAEGVESLVAELPRARYAPLSGAGHQPWRERPAEMRSLLRGFLLGDPD